MTTSPPTDTVSPEHERVVELAKRHPNRDLYHGSTRDGRPVYVCYPCKKEMLVAVCPTCKEPTCRLYSRQQDRSSKDGEA